MRDRVRDVPTSPHSAAPNRRAASRRFWRRLSSARRSMNDLPVPALGPPVPCGVPDEHDLLAFIDRLRLSVRAKVAAEQDRGLSLSEIVVQVREMVRQAEVDPNEANRFSSRAFRAIAKQAVAWCIESYRPLLFANRASPSEHPARREPPSLRPLLVPVVAASGRVPASSPNYRGIP
jgi:hypothetical protein